jgi:AraC-like DNA-binding protein
LVPNIWPRHRHAAWQITILFEPGICDVSCWTSAGRKVRRRLQAGDVWILPPGWDHSVHWKESADVIVLYLDPNVISRPEWGLKRESQIVPFTEYVAVENVLAELCSELRCLGREPNGASDWRVAGAGTHLAAVLLEAHLNRSRHDYQRTSGLAARILKEVREYLERRKTERVSVAAIARALGISSRHLRRLFRRLTGQSPQEWVTSQKAKRAKELLQEGHSPKETASATGFSDTRHLRRVFRTCYGVAPMAFFPNQAVGPYRP